ncbi:hypothetical protein AQJ84_22525 [Streptomyces resistomycificus]|nr:hypothetical protein AQJ84_22525 [Streptomyces resistomycificus]
MAHDSTVTPAEYTVTSVVVCAGHACLSGNLPETEYSVLRLAHSEHSCFVLSFSMYLSHR